MSEPKTHDYRTDRREGAGARLVVRKGNKYGAAHAGEHVLVDEDETRNRSTMEACMSLEDFEAYQEALRKAERAKAQPKRSPIAELVDAGIQRIKEDALRRAKEQAAREESAPPPPSVPKPEGAASGEPEDEGDSPDEPPPSADQSVGSRKQKKQRR